MPIYQFAQGVHMYLSSPDGIHYISVQTHPQRYTNIQRVVFATDENNADSAITLLKMVVWDFTPSLLAFLIYVGLYFQLAQKYTARIYKTFISAQDLVFFFITLETCHMANRLGAYTTEFFPTFLLPECKITFISLLLETHGTLSTVSWQDIPKKQSIDK